MIARHGCRVIGVDISATMRAMAADHVKSDRFVAVSPDMLDGLAANGFAADAALKANGKLFVLNNIYRALPTREQAWFNDGIDIKATLDQHFDVVRAGKPPEEVTPRDLKDIIFWSFYARKPA